VPNPFNQSAFEDERREQQHNRINHMTIEQAKIEIEQLEPVAEALWQKVKEADEVRDKALAEWSKSNQRITSLKTFIKVSEATCP